MPRIDRRFLDCTVYLYPTKAAADKGANWGGSGFLFAYPYAQDIDGERRSHIYVVTNSHVVREYESTVIRLNTHDDGTGKVIEKEYADWIDDWKEDDLALCMLDDTIMDRFRWFAPEPVDIVPEHMWGGLFDVGTDVITLTRFIDFDGRQANMPLALFGHIAALNGEPVKSNIPRRDGDPKRPLQDSFLIDCKVIPGTSGSPVFVAPLSYMSSSSADFLIGIVWGYSERVKSVNRKKHSEPMKTLYVNENTGLMLAIPAMKLKKFLERSDLVEQRKRIEQEAIEEAEDRTGGAAPAAATPDEDENADLFTEDDFEQALRKVARKDKPKDSEK